MKLSIIMPVYNESKTISKVIERVTEVAIDKEIIIVDDGSTDETRNILKKIEEKKESIIKIIFHEFNQGKGAAVRTGLSYAVGEIVVIQDADLEYDPNDFHKLIEPIIQGKYLVVYGSRFLGQAEFTEPLHWFGNKLLTIITNFLYGVKLTDMETCYKMFKREVMQNIILRSRAFELEPEITAKILKRGYKILELPISYHGRKFHEGKKITWRDGFTALWTLCKYRVFE